MTLKFCGLYCLPVDQHAESVLECSCRGACQEAGDADCQPGQRDGKMLGAGGQVVARPLLIKLGSFCSLLLTNALLHTLHER